MSLPIVASLLHEMGSFACTNLFHYGLFQILHHPFGILDIISTVPSPSPTHSALSNAYICVILYIDFERSVDFPQVKVLSIISILDCFFHEVMVIVVHVPATHNLWSIPSSKYSSPVNSRTPIKTLSLSLSESA